MGNINTVLSTSQRPGSNLPPVWHEAATKALCDVQQNRAIVYNEIAHNRRPKAGRPPRNILPPLPDCPARDQVFDINELVGMIINNLSASDLRACSAVSRRIRHAVQLSRTAQLCLTDLYSRDNTETHEPRHDRLPRYHTNIGTINFPLGALQPLLLHMSETTPNKEHTDSDFKIKGSWVNLRLKRYLPWRVWVDCACQHTHAFNQWPILTFSGDTDLSPVFASLRISPGIPRCCIECTEIACLAREPWIRGRECVV